MAEDKTTKKPVSDLLKLPKAMADKLKAQEEDEKAARTALEALKSLGIDTKEMEEKLNWAERTRKTLLDKFS